MRLAGRGRRLWLAGVLVLAAGALIAAFGPGARAAGYGPEQVPYSFCAYLGCPDGYRPNGALVMDAAGNLYGTTFSGGIQNTSNLCGVNRCGVVFELTPNGTGWTETVLYRFCSQTNCADGQRPNPGSLVIDGAGNLYGTTGYGGTGVSCGNGCGVVFELSPNRQRTAWTETVLYSFCPQSKCADGAFPNGGLLVDATGNLYGTTTEGGGTACPSNSAGCGVVFELSPNQQQTAWTETVLYRFCQKSKCTDGGLPNTGLIMDGSGNLYGTTNTGGANTVANVCSYGCGAAFELTPNQARTAWSEAVLYSFCSQANCSDGALPSAGLVIDASGYLYGTTYGGGYQNFCTGIIGCGVVFELVPGQQAEWTEMVLYDFCAQTNCLDGFQPFAGLLIDRTGNLYGTAQNGGAYTFGTAFELAPNEARTAWTETTLYTFCSQSQCKDGANPTSTLIMDGERNLYGTTISGGNSDTIDGTVFALIYRPQLVYAKGADFNGDGKGDILLRYSDGTVTIWEMNGASVLASVGGQTVPYTWQVAGAGDFNGDGKTDILWRYLDGTVAVWLMNGGTVTASLGVGSAAAGWTIVGTGDFDGDGTTDILWQYTDGTVVVWFMKGGAIASVANIGMAGPGWQVAGIGDFNGDGKADILWRYTDGTVAMWLMNGAAVASDVGVGSAAAGWTIAGTGDFNGDGKSDILWQYTDGTVAVWLMNGATVTSSTGIGAAASGWTVAGTADFTGAGTSDILWQYTDGTLAEWLINAGTVTSSLGAGTVPTGWATLE
ncbi:MAG: VCBS repeat-containing protein [Alphaproteobacteria bacterium]|nr:VCBS repeat-containing protein [Alphaproteobacteria bacterium]